MRKTVFVGGFDNARSGVVGGQLFACRSILDSPISERLDWLLLDTTQRSQPPPGLLLRAIDALRRTVRFIWLLVRFRPQSALIFTTYGDLGYAEKGLMVLLARLARVPAVLAIRSEIRPRSSDPFLLWYRRLAARSASAMICQGDSARNAAIDHLRCDPARLHTIKNWVDCRYYTQAADKRDWSTASHNLLFLGYLETFKGVEELIEALARLKTEKVPYQISICGDGSLRTVLEARARKYGIASQVNFRGWVDSQEKFAAMLNSGILVLPSHTEGMPNAVLEAMASGMAVVASSVGSVVDLISAEQGGIIIPPGDVSALTAALARLLNSRDLQRKMGAFNLECATTQHNIEFVWPQILELLEDAC